jgi:hypothetical protein
VADKQQIKEKDDDVIMMMMMIMEIVFFLEEKKRRTVEVYLVSHSKVFFSSFSLHISIFARDRLIDMIDDIFLIWQRRAMI